MTLHPGYFIELKWDLAKPDLTSGMTYIRDDLTSPAILQGSPSGRGTLFVDIKLKAPPQYNLLILVVDRLSVKPIISLIGSTNSR